MADRVIVVNNKSALARVGAKPVQVMNGKFPRIGARRVRIVNDSSALGKFGAESVYIASSTLGKIGAEPVVVVNLEVLDEMGIDY